MDNRLPGSLNIDIEQTKALIIEFIRNEIKASHKEKAVVGLSGGIDSAVVLHLCVEALGKDNVLAVMMPHRISNPDSASDAQQVIRQTGCRSKLIEISPMTDPYIQKYIEDDSLRAGNVFARTRMIILYDQSAAENALVVGTCNKSEILLGYATMHGDNAWAFGPIGDLYKAQVRALARNLGVIQRIIDKPPSADLWIGQTDEEEMGITYDEADKIFVELIDNQVPIDDLVSQGISPKVIEMLVGRIERFLFKRSSAPILRISTPGEEKLVNPAKWGVAV